MKQGLPERGELVVCRITKIHPNSGEAELVEYGKWGMIHVSEVAGRWVRDIREFIRENQFVVCRVMDASQNGISLSIKRVRREETTKALNEYKRERKADIMLEQIAKSLKKSREESYREVGFYLQEEFGSLSKAFEFAGKKTDLFRRKEIPSQWEKAIIEAAQKKFTEKVYRLKGDLELFSTRPDGMETIKKILLSSQKKGFEVSYITAPRYRISFQGTDIKKVRSGLEAEGVAIVRAMERDGGQGKFVIKE